jgi:cytochrome d ubiquinol oxidase subunit II
MIESLSASLELAASDPVFWLPLALMLLVCILALGLVLIDGIALGAGLLLPWVGADDRAYLLDRVTPWQRANDRWLLLLLGVSMAAFPLGWSATIEHLYLPMLLLVAGALLRSLAIRRQRCVWQYGLGSLFGALGFGLLLAAYVTGQQFHWSFLAFEILMVLAMLAVFMLLAASWLLLQAPAALAKRLAAIAAGAARWSAAGMVALSFMLAMVNPAVFYRWTHANNLQVAGLWWLVMLAAFVWLDRLLRQQRQALGSRIPLLLTWLLLGLMVAGVVYSIFPFLILDELTIWDAAAPIASLYWVGVSAAVIALASLALQSWDYRRFLARVGPQAQA